MAFNPLGLVTGLAGAVLPLGAAPMGIGKDTTNVTDFGRTSQYDPTKFEYGGEVGGANHAANRFAQAGHDAQNRQAAQAQNVGVDYGSANTYAGAGIQSRGQAGLAAGMMMGRATGAVPSIAGQQAALDMQRAGAAQASAGASARGAAGLAMAQQNAANNTATMQSAISNQAQINAANERMQAEQAAYGAYSGLRAGDAQAQAQAAQQAQYQAQLGAQQNQFNAQLQAQQRAQNDAYSLGLYGQENNVRNMQLNAGLAQQDLLGQTFMQGQGQRIGQGEYNANREFDYYKQFSGNLQGAMSAAGFGGGAPGGGGAMGGSNAQMANSATTGTGPMSTPNTNMAFAPPPTGSDDRMKFGVTPLGLLGLGGGSSGAPGASVDMGGKGYMSQDDVQQASTGLAGGGGGMPGMVGGGGITGGNMGDLGMPGGGGGMSGGLLSDDKAKLRAVYLQGRIDAGTDAEPAYPGLRDGEELIVGRNGARTTGAFQGASVGAQAPVYDAGRDSAQSAREGEADRDLMNAMTFLTGGTAGYGLAGMSNGGALINRGQAAAERANHRAGVGRVTSGATLPRDEDRFDPVTDQFARGLAPIQFEYKPGMGPGGRQTGVRAQVAETQPLTASMITRRPDGLRQIDPAMGLGTALAGVGHLAQKQQQQEQRLEGLFALAAQKEGYR